MGYGKPPKETRFKPGQSGNLRGRPRGSKDRKAIVKRVAHEVHNVNEDGQCRQRSILELVALTLRNLAAGGNVRSFRALTEYLAKYAPQPDKPIGVLVAPAEITPEEWMKRAEKDNEKKQAPARFKRDS